jgi:hypothetical protein
MLPELTITRIRRRPAATSGAKNHPFLPKNPGQFAHPAPPPARPTAPFDTRRTGIRFQVEAASLGRGAARDAAGRAGSLRGPRRVFLCADCDPQLGGRTRLFRNFRFIVKQLDRYNIHAYSEFKRRVPVFRAPRVSSLFDPESAFFSERPHECQIGGGEEFRPLCVRHSRFTGQVPPNFSRAPAAIPTIRSPVLDTAATSVVVFRPAHPALTQFRRLFTVEF